MPSNPTVYDSPAIAFMNNLAANLNSGFLRVYTGAQPALNAALTGILLVSLGFGATAFAAATASGGVVTATANAISNGTAVNTGTANYFALLKSDGVSIVATGLCGTSNSDVNMNSLSITNGAVVSCSSFVLTIPET